VDENKRDDQDEEDHQNEKPWRCGGMKTVEVKMA